MTPNKPQLKIHSAFASLGLLAAVQCGGTEADNPFVDTVSVSKCKSSAEYESALSLPTEGAVQSSSMGTVRLAQALTGAEDIPLGLNCIEWQMTKESLDLQISNFSGGCGVSWQGSTTTEGSALTWLLENPACEVARCGSCLYDTSAHLALPSTKELQVQLELSGRCNEEPAPESEWTLNLEKSQGVTCRYATPGFGQAMGPAGTAFTSCNSLDQPELMCNGDLECVLVAEQDSRCLALCGTDEDCELGGALACLEGHCVPRQ